MKGNGVFWAKPEDAIANNLYKQVRESKSAMPGMLAGVGATPVVPAKKVSSIWEGVKHLSSRVYKQAGGW